MGIQETAKTRVELDGKDAEAGLKSLRVEAKGLNAELARTKEANDLAGWDKANKALAENAKRQRELKTAVKDVAAVMNNLSGSSLTDLTRAQKSLNAELKKSTQNTLEEKKAFSEKAAQLQRLDGQIAQTRAQMRGMGTESQSMFGRMNDGLNKYGMMAATGIAAITGLSLAFRKLNEDAMAREDAKANLSALTGLTGDSLDWLAQQADKLSTTTTAAGVRITGSSKDILDAYTLMGSAKPELLKNKEALNSVTEQALTLAAAAKMEAGPAVEGLAQTMNQFSAGADQAGRYINVLAAGSKEGSAEIPDLTTSILKSGTAANMVEISIEQLTGSIEALSEKGVKGEIAGNSLKNIFLKLATGADEYNPKIVGLDTALDNLSKKSGDAKAMLKLFGEENITAGVLLINNRERVAELTKAVTGTNVAYEQAIINTSTSSAKLAQNRNQFALTAQTIASKLAPAVNAATVTTTKFLKVLIQLPEIIARYGPTLLAAAAGYAAYGVAVNYSIVLDKLKVMWTNNVVAAFNRMKLAMMSNPWGLAAAGVALLAAGMVELYREYNNSRNAHKDFTNELSKEKIALNDVFEAVKKTTPGTKERAAAISVVNEQYGKYLPKLLTEKSSLEEITTAQNAATNALIANIAAKNQEAELSKIGETYSKKKLDALTGFYEAVANTKGFEDATQAEKEFLSITNQIMEVRGNGATGQQKAKDLAAQLEAKWKDATGSTMVYIREYIQALSGEQKALDRTNKFYEAYVKSVKGAIAAKVDLATTPGGGDGGKDGKATVDEEANKKASDKALKAIDEEYAKQKLLLAKQYLEGKIDKEAQTFELIKLDVAYYQSRLLTAQKFGVDIVGEETKLVDAKQKLIDRLNKADDQMFIEMGNNAKQRASKAVDDINTKAEAEFNAQVAQWDREDKVEDDRASKKIEAAKKRAEEQKALFEQTGNALGELLGQQIAGQEMSAANFGRSMLLIALDTLHGIVRLAIGQIWTQSLANWDSVMSYGTVGVARAMALSMMVEGAFAVAKSAISGSMSQKASGDYTVIGATDGKTYHAPYSGAAKTGYYPSPTLISEQGGEVVIDAPTVRNIRMNSPHILSSIMAMRVPQYATGSYPAAAAGQASGDPELKAILMHLAAMSANLNATLANGIESKISYTNVRNSLDKVDRINSKVSKR